MRDTTSLMSANDGLKGDATVRGTLLSSGFVRPDQGGGGGGERENRMIPYEL